MLHSGDVKKKEEKKKLNVFCIVDMEKINFERILL